MKRVLHVIRKLDPGGIELWLMDVLRKGGVPGCRMEFLLETPDPGLLEAEAAGLGAVIHRWTGPSGFPGSLDALNRLLIDQGPLDAVHSHVHAFSAAVLTVARQRGVPIRIAHSHATEPSRSWPRMAYRCAMKSILNQVTTVRAAVSAFAACDLFGSVRDVTMVPAARDLSGYARAQDKEALRRVYGFAKDDIVIAHAGRLIPEKNQRLLADLAARNPRFHVLLAGDGPLRDELRGPRIHLCGFSRDLRPIFGAADCFAFPSLHEGLGMALIEAQAAGLSCVVSDVIPREAIIVPERVESVSLASGLEAWARAIRRAARQGRDLSAWRRAVASRFHVGRSIELLEAMYAPQ